MSRMNSHLPFLYTVTGIEHYPVIGKISPTLFVDSLSYQPEDTDIFVTSYPKSGTTWLQMIVWLMRNDLKLPEYIEEIIDDNFLEFFLGKEGAEKLPSPRQIKTHLPFDLVPYNPKTKYIYVCRNPFDVCISFYKHTCFFPEYCFNGNLDDYFELFMQGKVDSGDYFENLVSWLAHKDDENVLFLVYEQMKVDPAKAIVKIGEFLGGEFAEKVKDPKYVEQLKEKSSFETMKKVQSRDPPHPENESFFRKGVSGDHKNYLSVDQKNRLLQKYKRHVKGTHLEKIFECYI